MKKLKNEGDFIKKPESVGAVHTYTSNFSQFLKTIFRKNNAIFAFKNKVKDNLYKVRFWSDLLTDCLFLRI